MRKFYVVQIRKKLTRRSECQSSQVRLAVLCTVLEIHTLNGEQIDTAGRGNAFLIVIFIDKEVQLKNTTI